MAFYNEFPHTRNYDDDLRELIDRYNTLNKDYESLKNIYQNISNEINAVATQILMKMLENKQLLINLNYVEETKTLNFIFTTEV